MARDCQDPGPALGQLSNQRSVRKGVREVYDVGSEDAMNQVLGARKT